MKNGWYSLSKQSQKLTPQQMGLYHTFKAPSGVSLTGSGLGSVFKIPGINQTLNGSQLMNQVISRIKPILTRNNVHTIDTSPVSNPNAIGVAISSEPGTVHVDIAKIFKQVQNNALPSITQLDGASLDKDVQSDIISKISNILMNELANTSSHESKHNLDYFNSFPKGKFDSSESGAEGFGNQIANQYFKLSSKVATRSDLAKAVASFRGTLIDSGFYISCIAPKGHIWTGPETHEVQINYKRGWKMGEVYSALLDDISSGVSACENENCEWCEESESLPYGTSPTDCIVINGVFQNKN